MSLPSPERRLWRRRQFLAAPAGFVGGAVVAHRIEGVSRALASVAAVSLSPGAPLAFLSTKTVAQGEAFSLHVQTFFVSSGTATFNDVQFPLITAGEYLVGMLAAGQSVTDEVEIDPGDYNVVVDAVDSNGAPLTFTLPITASNTPFPVDEIQLDAATASLLSPATVQQELTKLEQIYGTAKGPQLWKGLFRVPVTGPITTEFGQARSYNAGPVSGHHSGLDIAANLGTPVGAAASGLVSFTGALPERGNFITIDHGMGVYTGYAHLSQINTAVGVSVSPGDIIGMVGSTGLSTGPHLHWECAVNGVHVSAMHWTRTLLP